MNQRARAYYAFKKLRDMKEALREVESELSDVLGEAQNDPPEGASDGSLGPGAWEWYARVSGQLLRVVSHLDIDAFKPWDSEKPPEKKSWMEGGKTCPECGGALETLKAEGELHTKSRLVCTCCPWAAPQ